MTNKRMKELIKRHCDYCEFNSDPKGCPPECLLKQALEEEEADNNRGNCKACSNGESYYAPGLVYCYAHNRIMDESETCGMYANAQKECKRQDCKDCPFDGQDCVYCRTCPKS